MEEACLAPCSPALRFVPLSGHQLPHVCWAGHLPSPHDLPSCQTQQIWVNGFWRGKNSRAILSWRWNNSSAWKVRAAVAASTSTSNAACSLPAILNPLWTPDFTYQMVAPWSNICVLLPIHCKHFTGWYRDEKCVLRRLKHKGYWMQIIFVSALAHVCKTGSRVSSVKMGKTPSASCENAGSPRAESACGCGHAALALHAQSNHFRHQIKGENYFTEQKEVCPSLGRGDKNL